MVDVTFQEEVYSDAMWEEFWPLFDANSHEVDDAPVRPNVETYNAISEQGALRIVSARAEGVLVGYLVFFLSPMLHRTNELAAHQDAFFLLPEYRRGFNASKLIGYAEAVAIGNGASVFRKSSKVQKRDISKILARSGYEHIESVFEKRLI